MADITKIDNPQIAIPDVAKEIPNDIGDVIASVRGKKEKIEKDIQSLASQIEAQNKQLQELQQDDNKLVNELADRLNIEETKNKLDEINRQIEALSKSSVARQLAIQSQLEGTGVTQDFVNRRLTRAERDDAVRALLLSSQAEALQGQLEDSLKTIERAIEITTKDRENKINIVKENLEKLQKQVEAGQTELSKQEERLFNLQLKEVERKQKELEALKEIAKTAAINDAPIEVIDKVAKTDDIVEAYKIAKDYLKSPLDKLKIKKTEQELRKLYLEQEKLIKEMTTDKPYIPEALKELSVKERLSVADNIIAAKGVEEMIRLLKNMDKTEFISGSSAAKLFKRFGENAIDVLARGRSGAEVPAAEARRFKKIARGSDLGLIFDDKDLTIATLENFKKHFEANLAVMDPTGEIQDYLETKGLAKLQTIEDVENVIEEKPEDKISNFIGQLGITPAKNE